jgi:NitT/TauT family transport system permease protein
MLINAFAAARSRRSRGVRLPNISDLAALALVFGFLVLLTITIHQSREPLAVLEQATASLDPRQLPFFAMRTSMRMLFALALSFIFSIVYGTLAAKSRRAETILVPVLDILQSIPILGYISFTVLFFLALFPGQVLGAELACVFAIFTGQAWNMTFSYYQSLRTLPADLEEVSRAFRMTAWQKFVRLELPFALPALVWNMMMSMSGGWFFIVAAEAIKVGDLNISLPGIGSYLALAIEQRSLVAVGWTVLTMLVVILLYDQLFFRPLVAWAEKFRFNTAPGSTPPAQSWLVTFFRRTRWLHYARLPFSFLSRRLQRFHFTWPATAFRAPVLPIPGWLIDIVWYGAVGTLSVYGALVAWRFITPTIGWNDVHEVIVLGFFTLCRILSLTVIASLIWVPVGVYVGLRLRLAGYVQPVAQFLAAFPANLTFPIAVVLILRWQANPDIWLSPLIILGTQWYILFNVIAGTIAFPDDLQEGARSFHIQGWLWWKRVMLPGLVPYYLTGALTAMGGAWNATIVAEAVSWGNTHIAAHGLGAYIATMTDRADYPRILLGILCMSAYVLTLNSLLWRPLYRLTQRRFTIV